MTLLTLLGLLAQIVGFIYLCRLGTSISDRLAQKSPWLPGLVATALFAFALILCSVVGLPMTFWEQTVALFCVAFAGALVIRQHDKMFG